MTHLAERGASVSTLRLPGVTMVLPNYGEQELVIAFARAMFDWMKERGWKINGQVR